MEILKAIEILRNYRFEHSKEMGNGMKTKEIVRLHPNDEGKLHPIALRRLLEWGENLSKKIPLSALSFQDLERWLTKDELGQWQKEVEEIREWLYKCLHDEFSIYCHAKWIPRHMEEIEKLIELVWRRKSQWVRQQQQKKEAEGKSVEYAKELGIKVNNFKATPSTKRRKIRFPKDNRDMGYDFEYLLPLDNEADYREVAKEWISEMVIPANLKDFVSFDYRLFWRFLPYAEYRLNDVPCLDIGFHVWLGIEAKFWLKPSKVAIDGYDFTMPRVEYPVSLEVDGKILSSTICRAPLLNPEFLGYCYRVLTSSDLMDSTDLGYEFWQTIPCVLIQGLMEGNFEPEGCTIIEAYEGWTNYQVDDYDEEVKMPDIFAQYLKEIGGWDSLTERGIITDNVMNSVQRAMARVKVEQLPELGNNEEDQIGAGLANMGYPKDWANRAAKYVMENYPDYSLDQKITKAIQLLSEQGK